MPSVTVILKNGHETTVEGANSAAWVSEPQAEGYNKTLMLLVYYREENKVETRGRFHGAEVAGYTIDVR